jgi:hypothetical protein
MDRKMKPDLPPRDVATIPKPPMKCFSCGGQRWMYELHAMGVVVKVCAKCGRRVMGGK